MRLAKKNVNVKQYKYNQNVYLKIVIFLKISFISLLFSQNFLIFILFLVVKKSLKN